MKNKGKSNHTENQEIVELRSNNTRRFIAEEPPLLVRIGTTVITFVLLSAMLIVFFLKVWGKTVFEVFFN